MAATNRYLSISPDDIRIGNVVEQSSSATTAFVELRLLITEANGTTATNLTNFQIYKAMEVFWQYLKRGGINEFTNSANGAAAGGLPLPGPSP